MIRFECSCGAKLKADETKSGTPFNCPGCGERLTVPLIFQSRTSNVDIEPETPELPATAQFPLDEPLSIADGPPREQRSERGSQGRFRASRVLQFIFKWTGILSIANSIFFLVFSFYSILAFDNPTVFLYCLTVTVASIGNSLTCLALSELLGGIIAFLLKNECYP